MTQQIVCQEKNIILEIIFENFVNWRKRFNASEAALRMN
jgi:hypothetical protein